MKGDFSRSTFHPEKHYSAVLMQQGRVQMDADWNEQLQIQKHRDRTVVTDVIGPNGAPAGHAGFRIDSKSDQSDLTISAGRLYLDGLLVENEAPLAFTAQAQNDFPGLPAVQTTLAGASVGLVYLDVWPRHITALEDPDIREIALGGPDTGTRVKTLWQVNVLPLPSVTFPDSNAIETLLAQRTTAATSLETLEAAGDPVAIATAQAQLDQIDGQIAQLLFPSGISCALSSPDWTTLVTPLDSRLSARISPVLPAQTACELLPQTGYQRLENQLYRVEIHTPGGLGGATPATFKWSRENGSIVTTWLGQDGVNLTVGSIGRDIPLGFAAGNWVELIDDTRELSGKPGTLVQVVKAEANLLTINDPTSAIKIADYPLNPKIRRWDQTGSTAEIPVSSTYTALEGGVEIAFTGTSFKSGDYWNIPARTAIATSEIGDIEWPRTSTGDPIPQPPAGIPHHYCRLALVYRNPQNQLFVLSDCRNIVAPLAGLTQLFYLGGDGQEALPGTALAQALEVGVSRGQTPLAGALVQFQVTVGAGKLDGGVATLTVVTGPDGIAKTGWTLDAGTAYQAVTARLLGDSGSPQHLPVRFGANLSLATEVAYTPGCNLLAGTTTVAQALDKLCNSLFLKNAVLHINDVQMTDGYPVRPNAMITPGELTGGLQVLCNQPISADSVHRSLNCYVTLYMPYPLSDRNIFDFTGIAGYSPVILAGAADVLSSSPTRLLWQPGSVTASFLKVVIPRLANFQIQALPVRLSIKGNFLLPANAPFLPLDAEPFMDPNGMILPTGDGLPGGDLDIFFYLVQQRPTSYSYLYNYMQKLNLVNLQSFGSFQGVGANLL